MIRSKWDFGIVDELNVIRSTVGDKTDIFDKKSIQLILYNDDAPVACGSIYFDSGAYHLAHLCVKKEFQGQYIGDLLIRVLIVKGFNMMAEKLCCSVPKSAVGFFEKYGFKVLSETREIYQMEVTPQTLILNSKCGHDCSQCVNKDTCHNKNT